MKKITMQEIADALNISRVTVWKVLNNYPGVSNIMRQQVLEKADLLGYNKSTSIVSESKPSETTQQKSLTVSVVVSRPESSLFWMNIIHYLARSLSHSNINLMYTYIPYNISEDYTLPQNLLNASVDGMVVLNVYNEIVLDALNKIEIPKVFLDLSCNIPFDTLSGDLFLFEGHSRLYNITKSIIMKGHERIGFIGDVNYAVTNRDRYQGFTNAMNDFNIPIDPNICLTKSLGIHSYYDEIFSFLDNLDTLPEAIVCVSDYVANYVLDYLKTKKIQCPEDIAISGYDGSNEYINLSGNLTTVELDPHSIGNRLAYQIIYRIKYPKSPTEVIYFYPEIKYEETTQL